MMPQALALLGTSLEDMDLAATAISATTADGVAQVAHTVARADQRAEDISRMARQLLTVLREFPRRGEALLPVRPVDSGPRGAWLTVCVICVCDWVTAEAWCGRAVGAVMWSLHQLVACGPCRSTFMCCSLHSSAGHVCLSRALRCWI